jgi:4-hydroxythreonine-4-phosphate dehydrogenase
MGDPAGIGPEVILKTIFSARANEAADLTVIGFPGPFERDAAVLGLKVAINLLRSPRDLARGENVVNLIVPAGASDFPLDYGIVEARCGLAAALCIERSAELALAGEIDAVVTAPISKESLNLAGYAFPGHTEFYRSLTGAEDIAMLLSLGAFRVVHVVTHTAIRDVPALIRKDRIVRTALLLEDALWKFGIARPRIAVSGLNPHAGEAGLFGREEIEEITPAVEELRARGLDVSGPFPPDTVFARAYSGEFDGVVAMYHDQGHIALKLAGFRLSGEVREVGGVNTTLGLPIIRTSADHGTAFDIAGKGIASAASMIEAVETAAALAQGMKKCKRDR